jgi:carbon storage regulator
MLILTRTLGQSLMIGDNIVFKLLDINGKGVHLGIEAPRSVAVHREEVYRLIQAQNAASDQPSQPSSIEDQVARASSITPA